MSEIDPDLLPADAVGDAMTAYQAGDGMDGALARFVECLLADARDFMRAALTAAVQEKR